MPTVFGTASCVSCHRIFQPSLARRVAYRVTGSSGGVFCWRGMRIAVFAAVLMLAAPADPAPRAPWLLFPIHVRRFDPVSSPFCPRPLGGPRPLHPRVDLVPP